MDAVEFRKKRVSGFRAGLKRGILSERLGCFSVLILSLTFAVPISFMATVLTFLGSGFESAVGIGIASFFTLFILLFFVFGLIALFANKLFVKLFFLIFSYWIKKHIKDYTIQPTKDTDQFGLWLGKSTGKFHKLRHDASISANMDVVLPLGDAAQNILIMGGIGSGKTTRAVQPMLVQLMDQDCGGLIFDIKGDFKDAVYKLAKQTGREVVTIGPGACGINLLSGLTSEIAATFLKSAYMLSGSQTDDPFWVDSATELSRNSLGVLSFTPHYSLAGLYSFIFDDDFRARVGDQVLEVIDDLDERSARALRASMNYYANVFDKLEDKTTSSIKATLAKVLSQFTNPDIEDLFCMDNENNVDVQDILNGKIFLVDLPLSRFGLGGKTAYTMIKLRYFNLIQNRPIEKSWNQDRPVFFMCDEYQEIVSCNREGLSDLNFWDKSRSAKNIGIISGQSINSFYAAVGKRDLTNALLQNFRQKICFRTEDGETLNYFKSMPGHVNRMKKSSSVSRHSMKIGSTSTRTRTEHLEDMLDPQFFRSLTPNNAICFLSIEGSSWDDVLELTPVYV